MILDLFLRPRPARRPRLTAETAASVAVLFALMLPLLIGIVGFAVDTGEWYERQTSLQSAADAAAVAADWAGSTASVVANSAADNATASQFNFSGGANGASVTITTGSDNAGTTFTATATVSRHDFFSHVIAILPGQQSASATAVKAIVNAPVCLLLTDATGAQTAMNLDSANSDSATISGTQTATAANECGIFSDSSAGSAPNDGGTDDAIVANGSGTISGLTVGSEGYSSQEGSAKITAVSGPPGYNNVQQRGSAVPDPYSGMGDPPDSQWPTITDAAATGQSLSGLVTGATQNISGVISCNGSANSCTIQPGTYYGLSSGVTAGTLTFDSGGTTEIYGGFAPTSSVNRLTLDEGTYDITGPISGGYPSSYAVINAAGGNASQGFQISGSGGSYNFDGGFYSNSSGYTYLGSGSDTGFYNLRAPYTGGAEDAVTCNSGSEPATGAGGAFFGTGSNITFSGGTYFFDGGLAIEGSTTVTFGPGIYYIRNGDLCISSSATVTVNGATFVLEGSGANGASFTLNDSSTSTFSAPTSGCVLPANYPESAYVGSRPFDGTNGEGICGILIYQERADTATDYSSGSSSGYFNGTLYMPDAGLNFVGSGTMSYGSSNEFNLIANNLDMNGSGSLLVSTNTSYPNYTTANAQESWSPNAMPVLVQ
jgi:Flp pilus assembly protein TadG